MLIKKNAKFRFVFNLVLLFLLFFIHCFWGNATYLVYSFLLGIVLIDNLENGFTYIVVSIPYYMVNPYESLICFMICVLCYIIKLCIIFFAKQKLKINKIIFILIGVVCFYFLLPFGSYNSNLWIKLALISFLLFGIVLIAKKPEVFRIKLNIRLLIISLFISCLFSLTFFISPYMKTITWIEKPLFRYRALFDNPNVLAMLCEVVLAIMSYFIISKKSNICDMVLFAVCAFIGLMTLSKTFFIILAIILIVIFCCKLKTSTKNTLITGGVVLGLIILLAIIKPEFFKFMWDRFFGYIERCDSFKSFMNMLTTDRYTVWGEYISYMTHNSVFNLLFGYGLGAKILNIFSPHNMFISMFYQLGIIGTMLLVVVLTIIIKQLRKEGCLKLEKAIILPIVVIGLILCVEDMIFYIMF